MSTAAVPPNTVGYRRSRSRKLRGRNNDNIWFWVFVGPFVLGLVAFIVIPVGWSVYLSFFEARGTVSATEWVGLRNYVDMFTDPAFTSSLWTFAVFAAAIVPLTYVLSLGIALMVARARWFQTFFRSVFFLPVACSYVVASLIWKMSIFSGAKSGVANSLLGLFGVERIPFLSVTNPPWYWLVIVTARLWLQVGFYMIIFLAGIHRINPSLYEAAAIDGASPSQTLRYITLPQLRPTTQAVVLLLLINAFQAFDEFFNIMTSFRGYPPYARPPLVYLYTTALGANQDFGHGSAGAVVLAVMIMAIAAVVNRLFRPRDRRVRLASPSRVPVGS